MLIVKYRHTARDLALPEQLTVSNSDFQKQQEAQHTLRQWETRQQQIQNLFLKGQIPDILAFPRDHSSFQYLDRLGKPKTPFMEKSEFSADRCNFSFEQHADIIPTATSTFSATSDLSMTTVMSPDAIDCGFNMMATQPELEITFQR